MFAQKLLPAKEEAEQEIIKEMRGVNKTKPPSLNFFRDLRGLHCKYRNFLDSANEQIFFKMKYPDYEQAFSPARLTKYRNACGGDMNKAINLYRHNIRLCQKFYAMLNVFEIVLRNAIDNHYRQLFCDNNWIFTQLQQGKMLAEIPQKDEVLRMIRLLTLYEKYSHDRIVSAVSFGFWTHLFTKTPFLRGGQSLLSIFPNRTKGLGQKTIFKELMEIKAFRNRIAHYEAICFDTSGSRSIVPATEHYVLIQKYVYFLGFSPNQLFTGLDVVPDHILSKINSL